MRELSLHILDLAQNSIVADATRLAISVDEQKETNLLTISIADNGRGMEEAFAREVVSPFTTTRTTRKVGLGIPLFKANAELTGGSFSLSSKLGEGTAVTATFVLDSIDRMPMGDLAGTVALLVVSNPDIDIVLTDRVGENEFVFDTGQIREILGGVPLNTPEVASWIEQYLREGIQELNGGA